LDGRGRNLKLKLAIFCFRHIRQADR